VNAETNLRVGVGMLLGVENVILKRFGGKLQVAHIMSWADYPELRFNLDNCRTLCMACHYFETFGRELPEDVTTWGHNLSHKGGY